MTYNGPGCYTSDVRRHQYVVALHLLLSALCLLVIAAFATPALAASPDASPVESAADDDDDDKKKKKRKRKKKKKKRKKKKKKEAKEAKEAEEAKAAAEAKEAQLKAEEAEKQAQEESDKKKKKKKKEAKAPAAGVRGPFDYETFRIDGALGLFDGGPTRVAVTASLGLLEMRLRAGDHFEIQLHYGFVFTDSSGTSDTELGFQSGNPYLEFLYVDRWGPVSARIGIGATAPAAFPGDDTNLNEFGEVLVGRLGYATAAGMTGAWDVWMWLPETLTVTVPLAFVAEVGMFDIGLELGTGVAIPLFDNPLPDAGTDIGLITQFAVFTRFVWEELEIGLKVTGVMEFLGSTYTDDSPADFSDRSQFAIEPDVVVHLGDDAFLTFRGTFPVDDAAAILAPRQTYCDPTLASGGCQSVWGLFIGAGGSF